MFATLISNAQQFVARYNNRYTYTALGVLGVFIALAGFNAYKNSGAAEVAPPTVRAVPAQVVGDISGSATALSYTGTVRAREEADVRAQKSGVVTSVNYTVGAYVPAGATIATIQSNAESAAVAAARAGLQQAQANLEKIQNGTRNEQLTVLATQVQSAQTGIATAQTTARNALLGAYAAADNAFPGGVDVLYTDPTGVNPQINLTTTNYSAKLVAQNNRVNIGDILNRQKNAGIASDATLDAELDKTEQELLFVKDTLDNILVVLAGAVANNTNPQSQIDGYTTAATAARAGVLGALSSLSAAKAAVAGAQSALTVAQQQQTEGVTGARPEDVKTAQAAVAQAQAGLLSAQAQFANTRITAPISGTLTTFTLKKGSFAQQFGLAGTLANTRAREVVVYVSPQRVHTLAIGTAARINDTYNGVVTEIAQGVAANASGIEVRVAVTSTNNTLTEGDTALVALDPVSNATPTQSDSLLRVPVSALKLKDGAPYVLTIVDGHAQSQPITIVSVEGDVIAIQHTLNPDAVLITDARGIAEGDAVEAQH